MTDQAKGDEGVDALVVEITVTAFAQQADGRVVGGNVADATVGFAIRTDAPPPDVDDERVMATLGRSISPIIAGIADTLGHMGYVTLGQVKDPISHHVKDTGIRRRTPATRIAHPAPGDTGRPS